MGRSEPGWVGGRGLGLGLGLDLGLSVHHTFQDSMLCNFRLPAPPLLLREAPVSSLSHSINSY